MGLKVWDGSKWAIGSQIKVWDGSAWKEKTNANVHIWTGSSWQKIHPPVALDQVNGYTVSAFDSNSGGDAAATITLYANGKIQTFISDSINGTVLVSSDDWLLTGVNSEYDVFVNNFSGDALYIGSAPTDGTRSALSANQTFQLFIDVDDIVNATFNLIICANNSSGISSNVEIQNTAVTLTAEVGI